MKRACGALVVSILCVVPAAASASRSATPEERAAILADVPPVHEYCFAVDISKPDPNWAAVYSATPRPPGCDSVGDGLLLSHRDPTGAWTVAYEGSAEFPTCKVLGLTDAVGTDLDVCAAAIPAAATTLTCFTKTGAHRAVRKPRTCAVSTRSAGQLTLRSLRWSNWGKTNARATGRTSLGRVTIRMQKRMDWSTNRFYVRACVSGGGWGRGVVRFADPRGGYDY